MSIGKRMIVMIDNKKRQVLRKNPTGSFEREPTKLIRKKPISSPCETTKNINSRKDEAIANCNCREGINGSTTSAIAIFPAEATFQEIATNNNEKNNSTLRR